jgi:hypothetical protein
MLETELKYFTPTEANRTLPLVRKIVKDILDYSQELKTITDTIGGNVDGNSIANNLISDIKGFMRELEEIGCSYKHWNFSVGLVDFPAMIDNEEVYLCWKSDEDSIQYYHGINEGFRGRKLIPEHYFYESSLK